MTISLRVRAIALACAASFAIAVTSLSGCADLSVKRIKDARNPTVGALVYNLPRTAVTTAVTVTLKKCSVSGKVVGKDERGRTLIELRYDFEADESATPALSTEADPAFQYAISYKDAETWLKEIKFTVETANDGTFKSFNGDINDQAGPLAVATLTTAVKIAGFAALPEAIPLAAGHGVSSNVEQTLPDLCSADVQKSLKAVDDAQALVDTIKKKKISKDYTQAQQDADVTAAQAKVASLRKANGLTRILLFRWVPSQSDLDFKISLEPIFRKWLIGTTADALEGSTDSRTADIRSKLNTAIVLQLSVDASTEGNQMPASFGDGGDLTLDAPGGLILRQPAVAWLRVCKNKCTASVGEAVDITDDLAGPQKISLPQLGQFRIFPEHSALFENANLVVSTNSDGSIASVSTHEQSTLATGVTGIGSAADAAAAGRTSYNNAVGALNTSAAAQASYADTINKALADCIQQQAAIEKAGLVPAKCQ